MCFYIILYNVDLLISCIKKQLDEQEKIFSEEELTHHKNQFDEHDNELLNQYIKGNTHNGKIQLLRRYYGISAKK